MKIRNHLLYIAAFALAACSHNHSDEEEIGHHHHHGHESVEHQHDEHEHEHEHAEGKAHSGEIQLDTVSAKHFNVKSEIINRGAFHNVISVSGQIIGSPQSSSVVTAPTSGIVKFVPGMETGRQVGNGTVVATISPTEVSGGNADASAKAAYEIAKRELDRLTPLYQEGLVTAKDYNAAQQAYEQAKAAYSPKAASGKATAVSEGVITQLLVQQGQYVDAGTPIAEVNSNKRLTLRADVPDRYHTFLPTITSANIVMPYSSEIVSLSDLGGQRVSGSGAAMSQNGYAPVFFSFNNNGKFVPGAYVQIQLIGSPRQNVLTVPVKALSEQQGHFFVYKRLDEDCYEKIPVTIGVSDGANVEILSGLQGGEDIVTNGVTAVRLAESSSVAPEGHSHNH